MAVLERSKVKISPPPSRRTLSSYGADVYAFWVGITIPFAAHFVGDLPIGEVLLLGSLPLLLAFRWKKAFRPELKNVYILMASWLLGLIVADVYNQTNLTDRMRGTGLIIFFGLDLFAVSILLGRNERRKVWLFVGVAIGALASVKLQPSSASEDYPWKFGYAWGAMQAALLICSFFYGRKRYVPAAISILIIIAVNLLFNFRSPVLYLLITLVLVFPIVPERIGRMQILPSGQAARVIMLAILSLGAAGAAIYLISFVTQAGYISDEAKLKNEAQEKGGNLLLGGRPEFVIGLRAALDAPIIGHGSWPHDLKYREMLNDMMVESEAMDPGNARNVGSESDEIIPSHSHIVGAWVSAGILGPIFWIYFIVMIFKGIVQVTFQKPALAPLYIWMMIGGIWDIFFSPFAFTRRIGEAILIVVLADLLAKSTPAPQAVWRRMGAVNPRRFLAQDKSSAAQVQSK